MILHIPHSSTNIPEELDKSLHISETDINLMTDWFTDELFTHPSATRVVHQYSRLLCDVERYRNDADEPMTKFGHGVVYTKGATGNTIRDNETYNPIFRNFAIKSTIYDTHHRHLNKVTSVSLSYFPEVVLVDCHSFNNEPLIHEVSGERPDFCIGTNGDDLPFLDDLINLIKYNGYSVELNNPFSGAMVPSEHTNNKNLKCVMIEVNRKLYLDDKYNKNNDFDTIKKDITGLLNVIDDYEVSKDN